MALDAQSNWFVEMAASLDAAINAANSSRAPRGTQTHWPNSDDTKVQDHQSGERNVLFRAEAAIHLPDETLFHILEYIQACPDVSQRTFASTCLLSQQWYQVSVRFLYAHPQLSGRKFTPFVQTICPSKNIHVRGSPLAFLVRTLDMSGLVHQSSKSTTARLLGRTKHNLEVFVAPQAGFAMNSFPALSKCFKLQVLDLVLVSESAPLAELLRTVVHLKNLHTFLLPRSAGVGAIGPGQTISAWPPSLVKLNLSGGINRHLWHDTELPDTLSDVTIEHCPNLTPHNLAEFLVVAIRPLKSLRRLKLAHLPKLKPWGLNRILHYVPQLEVFSIDSELVTAALFDFSLGTRRDIGKYLYYSDHLGSSAEPEFDFPLGPAAHYNLRVLELTNSGNTPRIEKKIIPMDLILAIDHSFLPSLRKVRVAKSLHWKSYDAIMLSEILEDAAREEWEADNWDPPEPGPIQDKEDSSVNLAPRMDPDSAGVWKFDG